MMMSSILFFSSPLRYCVLSDGIEAWCQFVRNAKDSREKRIPKTESSVIQSIVVGLAILCSANK